MGWEENLIAAGVSVFVAALATIGGLAYRRTRDRGLLGLTAAFALFLAKGVVLSVALFTQSLNLFTLFVVSGGFDFAILALFYAATLRR